MSYNNMLGITVRATQHEQTSMEAINMHIYIDGWQSGAEALLISMSRLSRPSKFGNLASRCIRMASSSPGNTCGDDDDVGTNPNGGHGYALYILCPLMP